MAQILFAWELGSGLGHAGRLVPLANELARRGHGVALSLLDLVGTHSMLREFPHPCLQAPVLLHGRVPIRDPMSLAEILQGCGYHDAHTLEALVRGWRDTLACARADLLVADYAPTALLAARTLRIPSVSAGLGFEMPPIGRPLPSLRPWEPVAPGRLEAAEAHVVRTAGRVLQRYGSPPLAEGWQLFAGGRSLLCEWPELDCYARGALPAGERWHGRGFHAGGGEAPRWPEGGGPRVFAYLKGAHPDVPAVLRALAARGCRTLCFMPDVESGKPAPVVDASIRYSDGPVDLASVLRECDLAVCHAGGGTVAQSLLAGVPLLLMPRQNEQGLNALGVVRMRAGVAAFPQPKPFDYRAALAALLDDGTARAAARAFAANHRDFSNARQTLDLCDAIESAARSGGGAAAASTEGPASAGG
ncbi:hypothetical protein BURK1_02150 [Burkholderiales bacterium]|nr:hypothetical protein BURK1_02150 [Burkholderiales bacterium]